MSALIALASPQRIKRNRLRWRRGTSSRQHYNYFREYEATTGRYVESDPVGLSGGVNTYAYVGGAPVHRFDSSGLLFDSVSMTCAQDPGFCAEILGDITKGKAQAYRNIGNNCLADYFDAASDLGRASKPFWRGVGLAGAASKIAGGFLAAVPDMARRFVSA